ncbi:MAG: hypothetical protein JXR48_02005 [Candidatus Delongbacteria bacterium]|nr:hypothetical protein [Candidatus Delongbacteria bacterium]MBN2833719.1 hypothetical protein [Candidatus Delongbacteria bacterium]
MKLLIAIILLIQVVYGYEPESVYHYQYDTFKKENLAKYLSKYGKIYSSEEIKKIEEAVKNYTREIEKEKSSIKNSISSMKTHEDSLVSIANYDELEEKKRKDEDEIGQSKSIDKRDLVVSYKGLYLIQKRYESVVDIDISSWKVRAKQKLITSDEIEKYNGIFIESITSVENGYLEKDYIKTIVSGKLEVDSEIISGRVNDVSQTFYYIIEVSIKPLEKGDDISSGLNNYSDFEIFDLMNDNYEKYLGSDNIPKDERDNLISKIEIKKTEISKHNKESDERAKEYHKKKVEKISSLEEKINLSEKSIKDAKKGLKELFNDINFKGELTSYKETIRKVKDHIARSIDSLNNQLIELDSKIIYPQVEIPFIVNNYKNDLCEAVVKALEEFKKTYENTDNSSTESVTSNSVWRGENKQIGNTKIRALKEFWIYPSSSNFAILGRFERIQNGITESRGRQKEPDNTQNKSQINKDSHIEFKLTPQQISDRKKFWNTQKWIAFSTFSASLLAGGYLRYEAENYRDDYEGATTNIDADRFYQKTKDFDMYSNVTFTVSIVPLVYFCYSWYQESKY